MKKSSRGKQLVLLLLASLLINTLMQMMISLPVAIDMYVVMPAYSWDIVRDMGMRIVMLTPFTALVPCLLMLCNLRVSAWTSLPLCILLLTLGPTSPVVLGQVLLGYLIVSVLARLGWSKARDLYYYLRAKGRG
ncbi:hypothetical protein BLX41_08865 [Pseudomonas protegens]|uniref:hypothetical protein n=1 Tax=Pseudomonas protegens TaxID=380021 RepID=UPI000F4CD4CF|nr:hypothetical protein [Pseudomonas protegens]ROL80132.1 hypothetical protein BLX41_08865 [Pseudomonas protegens]